MPLSRPGRQPRLGTTPQGMGTGTLVPAFLSLCFLLFRIKDHVNAQCAKRRGGGLKSTHLYPTSLSYSFCPGSPRNPFV
jgi:hypothetical protein